MHNQSTPIRFDALSRDRQVLLAAWWVLANSFPLARGESLPDENLCLALSELTKARGGLRSPKVSRAERRLTARPRTSAANPIAPDVAAIRSLSMKVVG